MKAQLTLTIICLYIKISFAQVKIVSWNLRDFGKSRDDKEINLIALQLRDSDIVAIQEVVAKDPGGAKAVARLIDELNRMGSKWQYTISDPTQGTSGNKSERYAYIWKNHKAKLIGNARLLTELNLNVEREPYIAQFNVGGKLLTIINYHACTHTNEFPERKEIASISNWLMKSDYANVIWAGDMNLEIDDIAFKPILKNGYKNVLNGEKTTLKKSCVNGNYLSSAEDNILHRLFDFKSTSTYILDFIKSGDCSDVEWKGVSYSDHLGIGININ